MFVILHMNNTRHRIVNSNNLRPNGVPLKMTNSDDEYQPALRQTQPADKYRQRQKTQQQKQPTSKSQAQLKPRASLGKPSRYLHNAMMPPLRNRLRSQGRRRALIRALSNAIHRPRNPITHGTHKAKEGAITFKVFRGKGTAANSVDMARRYIWRHCHDDKLKSGINPAYIDQWFYDATSNSLVVVALVNSRRSHENIQKAAAYTCCSFESPTRMSIDILCAKESANPRRSIKNAPIALMYALEDVIHKRQMSKGLLAKPFTITLEALPTVVGFYARLGFKRSPDACSTLPLNVQLTMANNYRAETENLYSGLGTHRPSKLKILAKFNAKFMIDKDQLYRDDPISAQFFMSKCLRWFGPGL